jgi:hypothetical protein
MPLGERNGFRPRAVARRGSSDDDDGAFGAIERSGALPQQRRLTANRSADRAGRNGFARSIPIVDGHRYECRAARCLHRDVVGTRDRCRNVFGARRLAAPFHVRLGEFRRFFRMQERLEGQDGARLLAGDDHQRCLVLTGGEYVAEGVAEACGRMQADERGTARRLRVTVGHADGDRFLQGE